MAWLGTWANRIEIDLDNSNVDSDLTHFPVLIKLGHAVGQNGQDTGVVFSELTTNHLKIAVTDEDGTTQLYVEVEKWDNDIPVAWLWASSSTFVLHADRPTKIYLYFDAAQDDNTTYVGVTNDVVAESVWDANFISVWHMRDGADTSHVYDSTSNDNDLTKLAANEPIETADGKVDGAQTFDDTDDFAEIPNGSGGDYNLGGVVTLETLFSLAVASGTYGILSREYYHLWIGTTASTIRFMVEGATINDQLCDTPVPAADTPVYIAATYDDPAAVLYKNGVSVDSATDAGRNCSSDNRRFYVGCTGSTEAAGWGHFFGGFADETRVSNIARSAAWVKATYYTMWDDMTTFNFCGDWLQSWKHRIAITIDSSKVDSDLTHFPVMIRISAKTGQSEQDLTRVFDEVGVEDQKIAVTDSTGVQQLYVEIEKWNATTEEAILWVSRADWVISSTADTTIYLYYDADMDDNTYFVDVTNSTPAERVWDEYFQAVYHMADGASNAAIYDSTGNDFDGTKSAANEPLEATAKIGEGQSFDGDVGDDDEITVPYDVLLNPTQELTVEGLVYIRDNTLNNSLLALTTSIWTDVCYTLQVWNNGSFVFATSDDGGAPDSLSAGGPAVEDTWYHVAARFSKPTRDIRVNIDAFDNTDSWANDIWVDAGATFRLGHYGNNSNSLGGLLDEVRVSNTARADAWLDATYYSLFDNMLTFATETATWKAGWDKRIKLTVSATNIDEALEWFPLMIKLSASCGASSQDMTRVFDELGVEDLKIAITEADGVTELYVEVEKWDSTNEEAILWVARDGFFFSSVVDTVLYLYYDADHADNTSYVAVSGARTEVWDANFVLVDHMQDGASTAVTVDSTSNNNDGAQTGSEETSDAAKAGDSMAFGGQEITDGRILKFDGSTDGNIDLGAIHNAAGKLWTAFEFVLDEDFSSASSADVALWAKRQAGTDYIACWLESTNGSLRFTMWTGGVHDFNIYSAETSWTAGVRYHVIVSISSAEGVRMIVDNGTPVTDADLAPIPNGGNFFIGYGGVVVGSIPGVINNFVIGTDDLSGAEETNLYNGILPGDEDNYYPIDEGTGAVATDQTGGDDGTIDAVGCSWTTGTRRVSFKGEIEYTATNFNYAKGTFECVVSSRAWVDGEYRNLFSGKNGASYLELQKTQNNRTLRLVLQGVAVICTTSTMQADDVLGYVVATWDFDSDEYSIYLDTVRVANSATAYVAPATPAAFWIGAANRGAASLAFWNGIIDEGRMSVTVRSLAWGKATYNTMWDNLVTFTIEGETIPEVLVDIAWIGDAMADSPDWYAVESAGGWDAQGCTRYHFKKGRQHALARMQTGQLDLVLKNFSGYYWPDKRNGPWYPYVISGAKIRVRCVYDGTLYPRFMGFIDEWMPGWLGTPGEGDIMTVTATDGMEHLANTVMNNAGEAEELSGTRIDNVLDEAGWPAADRDTSAGAEVLQATGAQVDINALSHINLVNDSELGFLFVAFDGDMTWHGRAVRDASPYDTSQATFGDDLSEMPYIRLELTVDRDLLFNEFRRTIIGGVEQTSEDTDSQDRYGKRTNAKTGLLNLLDIQAEVICSYLVGRYKNATRLRVRRLTMLPRSEASDLFPKAFLYDISTRITCRQNDAKLDRDYFIEGVEESAEANSINWRTAWELSDVTEQLFTPETVEEIIRPTGVGTTTTINDEQPNAQAHWDCVHETDDAEYVKQTSAIGGGPFYDTYQTADPTYGKGTINKVTIHIRVKQTKRTAALDATYQTAVRSGGTDYYGTNETNDTTDWTEYTKEYTLDPDTAAAWTWVNVNALEIGVWLFPPLTAGFADGEAWCSEVWAVVNFTPAW